MRRLARVALVAAMLCALIAGCGDDDTSTTGTAAATEAASGPLVVSAAASLQPAFEQYASALGSPPPRYSFAGSDELAAQIRQGVKPDVFASANTKLPDLLHDEGLVEEPTVFAGNRLVLAVPKDSTTVTSFEDVEKPQVKLAVGSDSVPIGSYTREVLDRLPKAQRERILDNIRSEEPDVKGIVGKLTQGAVDAGFVYITDVAATKGALESIDLPESLQPSVAYGVAVVKGAKNPERAQEFIDGLLDGAGRQALEDAGFEPPPQ